VHTLTYMSLGHRRASFLLLGIVWLDSASEAHTTDQSSGDQKISQRLGHPS
jgi:hypothetical protein